MDNRFALFGFAGIGAAAALVTAALRPPILAGPLTSPSAIKIEETRSTIQRIPPKSVRMGPDTTLVRYSRGRELLEAFLWQGLAGSPACTPRGKDGCYRLDVLIATLPDPYDSHLDWSYDSNLESIRRAFETAGFVTDRFWIPTRDDSVWVPVRTIAASSRGANTTDTRADSVDTRADSVRVPAREVHPGVILFRHRNPAEPQVRLLYLVGEIPTGGIHKHALQTALVERRQLLRWMGAVRPDSVRGATGHDGSVRSSGVHSAIAPADSTGAAPMRRDTINLLAPTFSGSALSLRRVLDGWLAADENAAVRILSGSATGGSVVRTLTVPGRVWYSATVNSDSVLEAVLRDSVLDKLGIKAEQVALLTESSTEYGRNLAGVEVPTDSAATQAGDTADPRPRARQQPFLVIPVPMNIYSLRTEYERYPQVGIAEPRLPGGPATPRIPLSLQDAVRPKESPPVTSHLTAPGLDLMLDEIVRVLREHDIRAVGVQATDVRDKLFLGELIRRRVRDVQLFTFESSALFRRTDFTESLRGMLVLSSYPLVLENQWWTPAGSRTDRIPFVSDGAEGVYNATLLLLDAGPAVVEYGVPKSAAPAADSVGPPVWLTVLGVDAFLPVRAMAGDTLDVERGPAHHMPDARDDDRHPLGFFAVNATFTLGLMVLFVGLVSSTLTYGRTRGAQASREATRTPNAGAGEVMPTNSSFAALAHSDPDEVPWEVERGSLLIHRELYTILLFFALAGLSLPPVTVVVNAAARPMAAVLGVGLVAVVWAAAVALSCDSCADQLKTYYRPGMVYLWRKDWVKRSRKAMWALEVGGRLLVFLLGVAYFVLTLLYIRDVRVIPGGAELFVYRALRIEGGVSPLVPLMITGLGFVAWSTWHLLRVELLARGTAFEDAWLGRTHRPTSPANWPARESPGARVADAVRGVRSALFLLIPNTGALLLLGLLVIVVSWLLQRWVPTVEALILPWRPWFLGGPTSFDALFRFSVIGTFVATSWAVYRLLATWHALHRVLAAISDTPLISAFERLPPQVARMTRLSLFGIVPDDAVHAVAATQWQYLRRLHELDVVPAGGPAEARALRLALERIAATSLTDTDWWKGSCETKREARAVDLRHLYAALEELWRTEPARGEIDSLNKDAEQTGALERLSGTSTTGRFRRSFHGPMRMWMRLAEEIAAVQVVSYIDWVLRHFRRLALFLLVSLLLTTALLVSYPFQPQSLARLIFFFILIATIGSLLYVMVQMNRDELLSRVTKTTPGRITWDTTFVLNVVLFAAVPLFALMSAEFPALRSVLFAWVDPLLQQMTKL